MGLQPGRRLAKSMEKSPLKPVPRGSFPSPAVTVNGAPLVAVTMVARSHPPVTVDNNEPEFSIDGRSHMKVAESTCRISKSHSPNRADLISMRGTAIEFRKGSPVTGAELKSRHLPKV